MIYVETIRKDTMMVAVDGLCLFYYCDIVIIVQDTKAEETYMLLSAQGYARSAIRGCVKWLKSFHPDLDPLPATASFLNSFQSQIMRKDA